MIETTIDGDKTMRDEAAAGRARLRPGDEILGRYVVQGELGQGGMGVVYQCLDKVGGVEVAVKGLPPEVSHNADEMEEVRDNYRLVQGLRHPNICGVKTLEMDAHGDYCLVMDLARGVNLNRWLKTHPDATDAQKLAILRQIAAALDYAHGKKIIHRDVKPENVMVADDGMAQVLDFGLAAQVRSSLSRTSQAVTSKSGTPGYKAPEQWRGQPQGSPADQYALGVIAYKLLAGRLPFDGDDLVILGQAVLNEPAPKIAAGSSAVNAALAKALAKKPGDRFASCTAFVDALEGKTPMAAKRPFGRIAAVAATLALLAGGGLYYLNRNEAKENVRQAEAERKAVEEKAVREQTEAKSKRMAEEKAAREQTEAKAKRLAEEKAARERSGAKTSVPALEGVKEPSAGEVREFELHNGLKMKFVWCPPGSFTMGSPLDDDDRIPDEATHRVTLTRGFWMGQFEVTQAQWRGVMGDNPSHFKGDDNRPVENVSWNACQKFISKCNAQTMGVTFALPTEAQWEYACRAGAMGPYAGTGNLDEMGWYDGNCGAPPTHPVGEKRPNAWNLYDMHGNVWEWCADRYGAYGGDCTDPTGPASGSYRVLRGGSWFNYAQCCRSAYRYVSYPSFNYNYSNGFRLCCSAGLH